MTTEKHPGRPDKQTRRLGWSLACVSIVVLAAACLGAAGVGDLLVQGGIKICDGKETKTVLEQNGDASVGRNLEVEGSSSVAGAMEVGKNLALKGNGDISGDLTVGGNLTIDGLVLNHKPLTDRLEALDARIKALEDVREEAGEYKADINTDGWLLDTPGDRAKNNGQGFFTSAEIVFAKPFSGTPDVRLGLVGFDISNKGNARLGVVPIEIKPTGFKIQVRTWNDTLVTGVGVQWTARGK